MGFFMDRRKKNGGRGDHTRVYIANTRRSAQFSLGKGNLTHRAALTSDFLKISPPFQPRIFPANGFTSGWIVRNIKYAEEMLAVSIRGAVALRFRRLLFHNCGRDEYVRFAI
jgi:hypothetical protein